MDVIRTCPTLRIIDLGLAEQFCLGILGLFEDWRHSAAASLRVSRRGVALHLTERHGEVTDSFTDGPRFNGPEG